jgi:hypothetical protein
MLCVKNKKENMEISEKILNIPEQEYGSNYKAHIIEQYKLYLTMIDKISDRRALTNNFFLTINTGLITATGIIQVKFDTNVKISPFLIIIVAIAAIAFCIAWLNLISSYKKLNSAKFRVIYAIEKLLPLNIFETEWLFVKQQNKGFKPFSKIEIFLPFIYIAIYISIIIYSLINAC